jgi:uncharacterized protein (TIGR00290 family)
MYGLQTKAAIFWSGGKDSALALWRVLQAGQYQVCYLIVTTNEETGRVSMHGVRNELVQRQAEVMDIPVRWMTVPTATDHGAYEQALRETLLWLKKEGINQVIFGDIFLEDLRQYRDEFLAAAEMEGVYPLWKENTKDMAHLVIESGIHAILVCVDGSKLSSAFAGRLLDDQLLADLPLGVDPCGEHGEFHTFVFDAPYFTNPIAITKGELVAKKYAGSEHEFWFQDLT